MTAAKEGPYGGPQQADTTRVEGKEQSLTIRSGGIPREVILGRNHVTDSEMNSGLGWSCGNTRDNGTKAKMSRPCYSGGVALGRTHNLYLHASGHDVKHHSHVQRTVPLRYNTPLGALHSLPQDNRHSRHTKSFRRSLRLASLLHTRKRTSSGL